MNSESIWSICKPVITAVLVKRDFTCIDFTAILVLFLEGGGGGAYSRGRLFYFQWTFRAGADSREALIRER